MIKEKASCYVHDQHDDNCPWCRVEHRRAAREGEYVSNGGDSIEPDPDPREEEVMVEDWRTVKEVKEALGLRGEPFHAVVQGNGVMFAYPQLKKDVQKGDKNDSD